MKSLKLRIKNFILASSFIVLIFNLIGCASAPLVKPPAISGIPGFYHRVERQETLWKISKLYDIDLDDLAKVNHISDTTNIEIGQLIFIPNRQKNQRNFSSSNNDDFSWPLKGKIISGFGQSYNNLTNKGINIQPNSSSDVYASRAGKVVFCADEVGGFGKTIIIDHGDNFHTIYSRISNIYIKPGDRVEKGTLIAKAGSAGRDRAKYLHFEIRKGVIPQNPSFYLGRW